jgi:hypothetical protein
MIKNKEKKHIIWTDDIDIKDYEDYFEEEYPDDDLEDYKKWELISELNSYYLEDERENLNIKLDNKILAIATLGLWNGSVQNYNIINSGNIRDILYSSHNVEWYSDGKDIRAIERHHDGRNYILYREIKDENNIDEFLNKIYNNDEITDYLLEKYTKSIAYKVHDVYGWKLLK